MDWKKMLQRPYRRKRSFKRTAELHAPMPAHWPVPPPVGALVLDELVGVPIVPILLLMLSHLLLG